jgi:hypothetical protein
VSPHVVAYAINAGSGGGSSFSSATSFFGVTRRACTNVTL